MAKDDALRNAIEYAVAGISTAEERIQMGDVRGALLALDTARTTLNLATEREA